MKKLLIICVLLIAGCYYDKESELYGALPCDTSNVTYSSTISGLLASYGCLGCHSGPFPSGNLNLQGYTNVRTVAVSGRLFGAISHSSGFSPMPQGGAKMNPCDINRFKAWIDAGAPNN